MTTGLLYILSGLAPSKLPPPGQAFRVRGCVYGVCFLKTFYNKTFQKLPKLESTE